MSGDLAQSYDILRMLISFRNLFQLILCAGVFCTVAIFYYPVVSYFNIFKFLMIWYSLWIIASWQELHCPMKLMLSVIC